MTANEKVNILMVDDQPAKLLSYEVILAELNENLIKATSANEALNVLLKTDIAVVLMDVSMPDVGGFELAAEIRQHPRFQKTAIIFISGVHLTDKDKIQGYRSGAVDYISVPVVPEVLRAKISIFVELHRKKRLLECMNSKLERMVQERTEALRKSEAEFRTRADLLELATEAIIVRNREGAIRFWNAGAEALYGWRKDEALGQDLHLLLQTIFPISLEDVIEALVGRKLWQGNLVQQTKDGREIVVACRKTLNHEGDEVLEVIRDVTDQLRAEEALRENEKLAAMGRVAGIIAHEINNPLAAITNIFYLLLNHSSLDMEARKLADLAEHELTRISHITRQTLSFYRESKHPEPVVIHKLLDEVAELQEREFKKKRITLRKKYLSSGAMHCIPVELRQVFLNLIGNAVQAMPEGGILQLYVRKSTDYVTQQTGTSISIIDTGIGIAKENRKRLFEPFFSTKSTKGTGLGLWISRGIVQKYSGQISYRCVRHGSECVTCFRVFLPDSGPIGKLAGAVGSSIKRGQEISGEVQDAGIPSQNKNLPVVSL